MFSLEHSAPRLDIRFDEQPSSGEEISGCINKMSAFGGGC